MRFRRPAGALSRLVMLVVGRVSSIRRCYEAAGGSGEWRAATEGVTKLRGEVGAAFAGERIGSGGERRRELCRRRGRRGSGGGRGVRGRTGGARERASAIIQEFRLGRSNRSAV